MIFHTKKNVSPFQCLTKKQTCFFYKIFGTTFLCTESEPKPTKLFTTTSWFLIRLFSIFWLKYATRISTQKKKKHTKVCQRGTKKVLSFHYQFSSGARLLWGYFLQQRVVSSIIIFRSRVFIFNGCVVSATG